MVQTLSSGPATANGASAAPPLSPPTPQSRRVLIAEADEATRRELQRLLQQDPSLQVDADGTGEVLRSLLENNYAVAIVGLTALEAFREVRQRELPVKILVTADRDTADEAWQALRLGACDLLAKPVDEAHLRLALERALRERGLEDAVAQLRARLQRAWSFHGLLSKNPQMHAVFELVGHVAHSAVPVLIEGEEGTGKERIARAIHAASPRGRGPFIAVHCAALPENLLAGELFGHEDPGTDPRPGRLEQARGGTLFLDGVADLPAAVQEELVHVLREGTFARVGGSGRAEADVRILATTTRPLPRLVKQGKFREDLYDLLGGVRIKLPALRERPEDIPFLAAHFAREFTPAGEPPKQLAPQAMEVLLGHGWPGNVRELENAIERACLTAQGPVIQPENLPVSLLGQPTADVLFHITLDRPLPELLRDATASIERQYLQEAMKRTRGNVGRCARICGLSRRSISAKLGEYRLDKAVFKEG
jgi:DNA-binding NtrC family response regulator